MTFFKWLAISCLVLIVGIPTLVLVVISTDIGSRALVTIAQQQLHSTTSAPSLSFDQFEGKLARRFQFSNLTIETAAIHLNIGHVEVDWRPEVWLFDSLLQVKGIKVSDVKLKLKPSYSEKSQQAELPSLITPWPIDIDRIQVRNVSVNDQLMFDELTTSVEWYAAHLNIHRLQLQRDGSSLNNEGQITLADNYPFKFQLEAKLATTLTQLQQPTNLQATLAGNLRKAQAFGAIVSGGQQLSWQVDTTDLLTDYKLSLNVVSDKLELNSFVSSSSPLPSLSALSVHATIDPRHIFSTASFAALYENSSGDFNATIEVDNWRTPAQAKTNSNINWNNISWPTAIGSLHSSNGELSLRGQTQRYQLQLAHELELPADFSKQWGLPNSIKQHMEAHAKAASKWQINTEIASLHNAQPFSLNIDADIDFNESLRVAGAQFELQTALLGQALAATGAGSYQQQAIDIETLQVNWNERLTLTTAGRLAADSSLNMALNIEDVSAWRPIIEQFYDDPMLSTLAGDIRAQATLRGTISDIQSDVSIASNAIGINGWNLRNFQFESSQQLNPEYLSTSINKLEVNLDQIGHWSLLSATPGLIRLDRQPQLTLTDIAICFEEQSKNVLDNAKTGSICIKTNENNAAERVFVTNARNLNWELPLQFIPERTFNLNGHWDLNSTVKQSSSGEWNWAEAHLTSNQFSINFIDDQRPLQMSQLKVTARYAQDHVDIKAELLPATIQGQLSTQVAISHLNDSQTLTGQVYANFPDLRLLQIAAPQLLFDEGNIAIDMALSGTLAKPKLTGKANVFAQQISFLETGTVFTNNRITLTTDGDRTDKLILRSESKSARGQLITTGHIDIANKTADIAIQGTEFSIIDKPSLQLDISPAVHVFYSPQQIKIRGDVKIPYARIEQPKIANTVTPSADVVIYENNELVRESLVDQLPIDAEITFKLGDDVRVSAYGFDGRLTGALAVTDDGKRPTSASGSINVVSGNYEIYGQELLVQRGSLIFTGGVLSNPGLDLRVIRSFPGSGLNSDVEVGAQVGGTITEPKLTLFSSPAMSDSEILSYLVLGRAPGTGIGNRENLQLQAALMLGSQGLNFIGEDLKTAFSIDEIGLDSGDDPNSASFFIGKYLNPRLYVVTNGVKLIH